MGTTDVDFFGIPQRAWPCHHTYSCKCYHCGNRYVGPKRSATCWLCTSDGVKADWEAASGKGT